jgi:hypothetical protein
MSGMSVESFCQRLDYFAEFKLRQCVIFFVLRRPDGPAPDLGLLRWCKDWNARACARVLI